MRLATHTRCAAARTIRLLLCRILRNPATSSIGANYAELDGSVDDQEERREDELFLSSLLSYGGDIVNVVVADPGRKAISNRIEPPRAAPIGAARALLGNHPHFRGRTDRFRISFRDGTLIVEGLVPTFYLKQMLQHALREMRGVDRIEYRVAVVNPAG